jgi:uncharacterized membrane protein HdeD (DUF308 family)
MESVKLSTGTKVGYILLGIISCIAGIWLFMYPSLTQNTLALVLGWMLVAYGIVTIISYFAQDLYRTVFRWNLLYGILLVVLGFVLLMNMTAAMNFLGIVVGIALLVDCALRIWLSIEMKRLGISAWWLILILAVLTGIVGFMFVLNPGNSGTLLTMYIGAAFLTQGFLDLSVGIFSI